MRKGSPVLMLGIAMLTVGAIAQEIVIEPTNGRTQATASSFASGGSGIAAGRARKGCGQSRCTGKRDEEIGEKDFCGTGCKAEGSSGEGEALGFARRGDKR